VRVACCPAGPLRLAQESRASNQRRGQSGRTARSGGRRSASLCVPGHPGTHASSQPPRQVECEVLGRGLVRVRPTRARGDAPTPHRCSVPAPPRQWWLPPSPRWQDRSSPLTRVGPAFLPGSPPPALMIAATKRASPSAWEPGGRGRVVDEEPARAAPRRSGMAGLRSEDVVARATQSLVRCTPSARSWLVCRRVSRCVRVRRPGSSRPGGCLQWSYRRRRSMRSAPCAGSGGYLRPSRTASDAPPLGRRPGCRRHSRSDRRQHGTPVSSPPFGRRSQLRTEVSERYAEGQEFEPAGKRHPDWLSASGQRVAQSGGGSDASRPRR
jgi:hypothetical protein